MDLSTTLIGLAILLFCVIIFAILTRNNNKKEKQLLQSLKDLAEKNNGRITLFDTWNNSAFGIDDNTNIVFAIKTINNAPISYQVPLAEISHCRVINIKSSKSTEDDNFRPVEKLQLAFTHHDKNKPEVIFDFYNAANDYSLLNGELQLIEKWRKIANDKLKTASTAR